MFVEERALENAAPCFGIMWEYQAPAVGEGHEGKGSVTRKGSLLPAGSPPDEPENSTACFSFLLLDALR